MGAWSVLDILETVVFWALVFYIAWNESATPQWAYVVLFVFLIYFAVKAILKKQGMDRAVWIYTLNMAVILYLMYKFTRS
jgi:hypothetical protein